MATPYNGFPSWNAWNVSLWINNDEGLYNLALECVRRYKGNRTSAARAFSRECGLSRTPDGGKFTQRAIYGAMEGME